jgi:hypothetical protein
MTGRLASAKPYFFLAMRETILTLGDQFYDYEATHMAMAQKHPDVVQRASQLIKSGVLFRICLEDFIKYGWVDSIDDEFAALFIRKNGRLVEAPASDRKFQKLHEKYESLGSAKDAWLDSALVSVLDGFEIDELNEILSEISLTKSQDEQNAPTASDEDWSPIPLDRNDLKQTKAVEALEKIVEELRGDNGYAATNPEEKAYVQDKLLAVTKRLKDETQISWMYLSEFAFKPLGILIRRFGGAAVGIAATAAKESLVSWLKSRGISFLDDILK